MGVATDGDVALCHRFAGSDAHKLGDVRERRQLGAAAGVPRRASHRREDRLPHLLGAADLRGRLLSRSQHALRIDRAAEPALLRMDSRLDAHVPRDLRRDRGEESRVPPAVRRRTAGEGVVNHDELRDSGHGDRKNQAVSLRGSRVLWLSVGGDDESLKAINRKAARMEEATQRRRGAAAGRAAAAARAAAHSERLLAGLLAGLGSGSQRRHGGAVPAGRARPVRLPHGLLLAGAGARPAQSRARLDGQMRGGAEGLAQDRSDLSRTRSERRIAADTQSRLVTKPHMDARCMRRMSFVLRSSIVRCDQRNRRSVRRRRTLNGGNNCSTSAPTPATSRSSTRRPRSRSARSSCRPASRAR